MARWQKPRTWWDGPLGARATQRRRRAERRCAASAGVAGVERELERPRVGQVHDRRQPAEAAAPPPSPPRRRRRRPSRRRASRRSSSPTRCRARAGWRRTRTTSPPRNGATDVRADAGQVRHGRSAWHAPVGERRRQDAAPHARPHDQARHVQQERDRQREEMGVAEAIAQGGRRRAQLETANPASAPHRAPRGCEAHRSGPYGSSTRPRARAAPRRRRRRRRRGRSPATSRARHRRRRLRQHVADERPPVRRDRELRRRRGERRDRPLPEQDVEHADHDRPAGVEREQHRRRAVGQAGEHDAQQRPADQPGGEAAGAG